LPEVAAIAENTPRVIEKHYNHFIQTWQDAINRAVMAVWGSV
jgi:hypothetical protein